jgi:hypothetical protein
LVPAKASQDELRCALGRWGIPKAIRVDNGSPWGSTGELPTDLSFWLIGMGIEMIWNPPRQPQDNGVVERSQGTGKRWGHATTCADIDELRARVEYQDRIQRERYPSLAGRSRLETFPALAHSGRPYVAEQESEKWNLQCVLEHLAGYVLIRRVDSSGTISLYNRSRYVGTLLKGRDVYISLDPIEAAWVYADKSGATIHRQPAKELTADNIRALGVSNQRIRDRPRRNNLMSRLPEQPHVA